MVEHPAALTAAIVAGGRARRLGGRPKDSLVVGDARVIDRQLSALGHVAEHILIVSNDLTRFRTSGLPVCADLIPDVGPLGGLYTALARSPTTRTLVVACDLPFLDPRFLRYLAWRAGGHNAAIPRTRAGPQPLCAVYDRVCLRPIRDSLEAGERRAGHLPDILQAAEIGPAEIDQFDPDGGDTLFFNINTPDDLTRARRRTTSATPTPDHDPAAAHPAS